MLIVAIVAVTLQLTLLLWFVSKFSLLPQTIVVRTSFWANAANSAITTFILFTSIRSNTNMMIIVILTTISITVAVVITLTSIIVLIHIIVFLISTIVAIIVAFMTDCTTNVITSTANTNASISIPAPVLLRSLLLLVRVPTVHNN